MRLIDADELKECLRWSEVCRLSIKEINEIIDNAPTVELPDFKEGYKQAILDGKTNFSRPQGEMPQVTVFCENADEETLEDIKKELKKVLDKLKERNDE